MLLIPRRIGILSVSALLLLCIHTCNSETVDTVKNNIRNGNNGRRAKISEQWGMSSEEIFVDQVSYPELLTVEYNYDFDFELAVMTGLTPNLTRSGGNLTITTHDLRSSPGCPMPYEGRPWVYYGKPRRCYLSGYQFPCSKNMKLLPQRSSSYGFCACNCSAESYSGQGVTSPQSYCLGHTSDGQERILAYRKNWNGCYSLFEQEKCPEGKWLVMSTESPLQGPVCKTRKCASNGANLTGNSSLSFYDYGTKSCHKIGDRCNSTNIHLQGKNTYYKLTEGDWIPACTLDLSLRALSYGIAESACGKGQRISRILGSCIPRNRFGGIG